MKAPALIFLLLLTIAVSAQRYRVVISEIMADPTPSAGLPEYEWVELYNRSSSIINLAGWRIGDASGQSGPLASYELKPGSAVLIAGATASAHLSAVATCLAVTNWPSLDNAGDLIVLYDNTGEVVHAVRYDNNWFSNPLKKEGGWTLEIQSPDLPCLERTNWTESSSATGGTPGVVLAPSPVVNLPSLTIQSCYPVNQGLIITWLHAPDAVAALDVSNYRLENGPAITGVELLPPLFNQVKLVLADNLPGNIVYNIIVQNITSCTRLPAKTDTLRLGWPQLCEPGDIIINELLFNPLPNGFDYLEIVNRSEKIFDAAALRIASRNSSGQLQSPVSTAVEPELFFPEEYRVYTTDTSWLTRQYKDVVHKNIRQLPSFPSYPDREGTAVLLSSANEIIDEVSYNERWHFPLLATNEGVSIERISFNMPSGESSSWHSSSAGSGFGTPGYKNSQSLPGTGNSGQRFSLAVRRLSPNNDGFEDRLIIQYNMSEPGVMAGIRLFDARGRPVRILQGNVLLGNSGYFAWDGLDDQQRPLPPGIYIVWVEWFDLQGKRKMWKEAVVLSR